MNDFMILKGKDLNKLGLNRFGIKRKLFESTNSYRRRLLSFINNGKR